MKPGNDDIAIVPNDYSIHYRHMNLRDYFAAQVLASSGDGNNPRALAEWAYQVADEMMKRRAKRK